MIWFFTILAGGSLLAMLGMVVVVLLFRDRRVLAEVAPTNDNWSELFWLPVDYFAYHLPIWLKALGRYFSLYVLVYLRHSFRFLRGRLLWLEHYFADLIDLLRGRGVRGKRGSASLFLEQISRDKTTPPDLKDRI